MRTQDIDRMKDEQDARDVEAHFADCPHELYFADNDIYEEYDLEDLADTDDLHLLMTCSDDNLIALRETIAAQHLERAIEMRKASEEY